MKYIFRGELSKNSIDNLIEQIKSYQEVTLSRKCDTFVRRLTELGLNVSQQILATDGIGDADREGIFSVAYNITSDDFNGTLSLTSTPHTDDNGRIFYPHLAWEFGAGIHYNNGNANPKAAQFGLGVGTFPDQKYALNPGYWYYKDENEQTHLSLGTQATMPMYRAATEIMRQVDIIAKEVFG